MADPFLSEIRVFGSGVVPRDWAACNGQLLDIATNQALFSLLGTAFGGDGIKNFALPDLQGRAIVGSGKAQRGQSGGETKHTLVEAETPTHIHMVRASEAASPPGVNPLGSLLGPVGNAYAKNTGSTVTLSPDSVGSAGGSEGHDNMMPFLGLNVCISLSGLYPSRN